MCTAHWKQQGESHSNACRFAPARTTSPCQHSSILCTCKLLEAASSAVFVAPYNKVSLASEQTVHCPASSPAIALRAAVKLGVMDAPGMADSAVPINQLAAHTSSNEDHLYRLLRYLAQFGIYEELPGQAFKLTSMGQHLRADHPSGLCYAAASFGAAGQFIPWMHLDKAVKEGGCFGLAGTGTQTLT